MRQVPQRVNHSDRNGTPGLAGRRPLSAPPAIGHGFLDRARTFLLWEPRCASTLPERSRADGGDLLACRLVHRSSSPQETIWC